MVENAKYERLLTFEGIPRHQNHAKMNIRILGDAMAMQRQNDENVINCIRAKAQHEWDKMVIVVKQCLPLPKPTLVKLVSK